MGVEKGDLGLSVWRVFVRGYDKMKRELKDIVKAAVDKIEKGSAGYRQSRWVLLK